MIVTRPGALQVNVGVAVVPLAKLPEAAVHASEIGEGPASLSCAAPESATGLPTATSAGLAEIPSTTGHTLIVPFTEIDPVRGGS